MWVAACAGKQRVAVALPGPGTGVLADRFFGAYHEPANHMVLLTGLEKDVFEMKVVSGVGLWVCTATIAVLVSSCKSMAPDYVRPEAPVPENYMVAAAPLPAEPAPGLHWRQFFTDPALRQLIDMALEHNRDLRAALLRVEEARAAYGIQRSERMPDVSLGGQGVRSRMPADLSPAGRSMVGSEYRAEAGLTSWELDLWGRVRSLEQGALESWLATEAAGQAVKTSLIAEVATVYLALRETGQRLDVTRETVASRERSYQIFQRRYEAGATAKLEVTQVRTLLTQAQVLQAQLEQQQAMWFNTLRLLAGDSALAVLQQQQVGQAVMQAALQPGLPSALLTSRPDIIAAEHRLRAANANIGAARAAFFPRIALTGSFGSASAELDDLFGSGSKTWTFMPSISLPIFDGGRRRANLELSRVRSELAVAQYEQTIQNAFREVADALAVRHWLGKQLEARQVARDAQSERARLAQLRYDNGSAAYLEVLDAHRDLLATEQQLISTRYAVLISQVDLYRALGGGAYEPEQDGTIRPISSSE